MALWRTRTLTAEQKAQIAEEQEDQEERSIMVDDNEIVLDAEEAKMSKIYGAELPINVSACNMHPVFFALFTLLRFQASKRDFSYSPMNSSQFCVPVICVMFLFIHACILFKFFRKVSPSLFTFILTRKFY